MASRTWSSVMGVAVAAAVTVGLAPGIAAAAPSNGQIAEAERAAARAEQQIRDLSGQLARAQDVVAAARTAAVIALDEYQAMQGAYQVAQQEADMAAAAAAKATADLEVARDEVIAFARRSYMEGSTYAGAAALITAADPAQMIERAALLEAAGSHRSAVLDRVTVLQEQATAADAAARSAVADAAALRTVAEEKLAVAQAAEIEARQQATALVAQQGQLQAQLAAAEAELASFVGARAAAERTARVDRPSPAPRPAPIGNQNQAGAGDANAAAVAIDAAKNYLGLPYAWGGGGTFGPGPGLHPDTGVIGFDCSGLTQYAYAQAGISIPRNSRAQYAALPKVPSHALQPGDLVFWANDASDPTTIYHVAIYLGGDQVIQAPQSGDVVKISAMWWSGYAGAVRPSA
ncbi:C40 family peptidase [Blastococcus sp. PRF04-17]|uniref:C40 family peptidase n=1 Tax=Blastococcus sp. PRF04-17 TaxID=2933797 RepID=UPI001FF30E94|nr:C40 family peptidase [Blastococcus sp. PRF04-17]UOY02144.1 C40 family peptidase [Blastococcus sp. PRF04-17]